MFESALTAMRTSSTKVVLANETSFWRAALLVVEPHSMSMVPFCISGTRFCEVTGWYCTLSFLPTAFSMFSIALSQIAT